MTRRMDGRYPIPKKAQCASPANTIRGPESDALGLCWIGRLSRFMARPQAS